MFNSLSLKKVKSLVGDFILLLICCNQLNTNFLLARYPQKKLTRI